MSDPLPRFDKRAFIRANAAGRSFVDIGGLWGTLGETVTTAAAGGAAALSMADMQPPDGKWWQLFRDHCATQGVGGVAEVVVDVCAPDAPATLGTFDMVHCSGVMYHVPDLFGFLHNLRAVTRETLILGSVTLPPRIETARGTLEIADDTALLVPTLDPDRRAILLEHFRSLSETFTADGISRTTRFFEPDGRPRYGPWWWLFTGPFMARLVESAGFEIVDHGPAPAGMGWTVVGRRR